MVGIPNPGSLPIDLCAPLPNGNTLCFKSPKVNVIGPQPCQGEPGGTTPPLTGVSITIAKKKINFFGDDKVKFSESLYVGVDQGLNCVYVGQATSEQCASFCPNLPDPTAVSVSELADKVLDVSADVVHAIEDDILHIQLSGSGEQVAIVVVAFLIAAILVGGAPAGV